MLRIRRSLRRPGARARRTRRRGLDLFVLDAPHLLRPAGQSLCRRRTGAIGPTMLSASPRLAAVGADIGARRCSPAFLPDVVHAHDWQAALRAGLSALCGRPRPGTVMTVHNLAFQGQFPAEIFWALGLAAAAFVDRRRRILRRRRLSEGRPAARRPHHHGVADLRRGNPDGGMPAWGSTACCAPAPEHVSGILNGIDDGVWNPATDPLHRRRAIDIGTLASARWQQGGAAGSGSDWRASRTRCCSASSAGCPGRRASICCSKACRVLDDSGAQLALLGSGDPALESGFAAPRRPHPRPRRRASSAMTKSSPI